MNIKKPYVEMRRALMDNSICLLLLSGSVWYALGDCAWQARYADSSIVEWWLRDGTVAATMPNDDAKLCSFLAKMVRIGKSVALAEDRGDGYHITRVVSPGTGGKEDHDGEGEEGEEL